MPRLVIDTNIWLDLLVFHDPRVQALQDGLASGHYRAIGTHAMLKNFSCCFIGTEIIPAPF